MNPATAAADFRKCKFVEAILKAPAKMEVVDTVMIPLFDGWDELPKRIREHKEIEFKGCDAFIGVRLRYAGSTNETNRFNWAAVNLTTGVGVQYKQSFSSYSGRLLHFDISPANIAEEETARKQKRKRAAEQAALTRREGKCFVHGFGTYYNGYEGYDTTLKRAQEMKASSPRRFRLWEEHGKWNLEEQMYVSEESDEEESDED